MTQAAPRFPLPSVLSLDPQTPQYKWLVAGIILLASATQIFAGTSLHLAIPRLMATFGTDLAATQWVATSFLITRTLSIPLLGWLGSLYGNRHLFVAIMGGFVLTSLGCGFSTSLPMLIGFRALQGAVMGPLEGLTAVMLVQTFPARQRGLAIGLRNSGWAVGELLFYTVGSYLLEQVSWRLLFFLGLPSGVMTVVLGLLLLPQQPEVRRPAVDALGLLCLGGFLVPLLLVISLGRDSETAVSTLVGLGVSAVLGGSLFVVRELSAACPAVNLRLFQQPAFCLLCGSAFWNSLGLFGALFMVPIFLQQVLGLTPLQASVVILPAIPFSALSGLLTGRLTDRLSPPLVAIGGLLALTLLFQAFASVTALTTIATLVGYMVLYYLFMDAVGIPITALTVQTLPADQVRMGQGLLGVVRSIGASLGVTVTSVFFERRRAHHQWQAYSTYDPTSSAHESTVQDIQRWLHDAGIVGTRGDPEALETIRQQMDIETMAISFQESFLFIGLCFILAIGPMLCLLSRRLRVPVSVA